MMRTEGSIGQTGESGEKDDDISKEIGTPACIVGKIVDTCCSYTVY